MHGPPQSRHRQRDVRLLISVRNASEAERAIRGGADWIDVKEPQRGALGAADASVVRQVVAAVQSRVPVSVALGELLDADADRACSERTLSPPKPSLIDGVVLAKYGLAGCADQSDWRTQWHRATRELPTAVGPVAVVYADWRTASAPDPMDVVDAAVRVGCRTTLIDTFDKSSGNVFGCWPANDLARFVLHLKKQGMMAVLGGSLKVDDFETAVSAAPDYLAIRGAACAGDRRGELQEDRVREISHRLAELGRLQPSTPVSRE